jgi:hypothetical protein
MIMKPAMRALAAGIALAGLSFSAQPAEAQAWQSPRGWHATQSHLVVHAGACAPLRGYRENQSRYHAHWSRQRSFTLRCAPGSFHYIPSRAERMRGARPHQVWITDVRWDARRQHFVAPASLGGVPVRIVHGPSFMMARRYM